MKFVTTFAQDKDSVWAAECPSIPGCVSQGGTQEKALQNIQEAIVACLEVRAEQGMPLTAETREVLRERPCQNLETLGGGPLPPGHR